MKQPDNILSVAKPYLLRAIWQWCTDSGLTPYLLVSVDEYTSVPRQYVREGQIVLNISSEACGQLDMDNDYITFNARFGGRVQDLCIPVGRVIAIYARETTLGLSFDAEETPRSTTQGNGANKKVGLNSPQTSTDKKPPSTTLKLVD